MENEVMVYDDNVPAIADDSLLRIAEMAERRIDAVVKIKQMALKVTNANDWNDQGGRPYLQVSGSEKVANLFNISWRIDEPVVDTEADGHFTYTFRGIFSIPGRSISAEGSRSSKDPFFKKYDWIKEQGKPDKKVEKPISAIDRRDVRMAALTNLLGNGITRLLGIRNLSYDDLDKFAGIKKADIGVVDYKGKGKEKEPLKEPQKKGENGKAEIKDPDSPSTENQHKAIHAIFKALHIADEFEKHRKVSRIIELPEPEVITSMAMLKKGQASKVIETLSAEADAQRKVEG
jgi:hypothetical protein